MTARRSRFANARGVLFAADLTDETEVCRVLDMIASDIDAIKVGNSLIYRTGIGLIQRLKLRYKLPIVADLKVTDITHIARSVVCSAADAGADAVTVSAVCGREVLADLCHSSPKHCEIWVFTEFTHDDGLIEPALADRSIRLALAAGVVGFQVPGTRTYRIEEARELVGQATTIIACGIGIQGGEFGSAIAAGANFEIIGRAIYASSNPSLAAKKARNATSRMGPT